MRNTRHTPTRTPRADTTRTYLERINLAIDHIEAGLHRPLRLTTLSRAARMSPWHFHRVFQGVVGQTPGEFVKTLRLERALVLMSSPGPPTLTRIALSCGFASSSDFSRCFRQRFGVAPSRFDLDAWRRERRGELDTLVAQAAPTMPGVTPTARVVRLPRPSNPDRFRVVLRELPARTVAYIRVSNPYRTDAVPRAAERLMAWADRLGLGHGSWLGYQRENPEIVPLERCRYCVAVVVPSGDAFTATGEIGRARFPPMLVAQVEIVGGIDLELRALRWLYGSWLPRSGYEPDDHPGFEAWRGRPFAHGYEHFELDAQIPVRRLRRIPR